MNGLKTVFLLNDNIYIVKIDNLSYALSEPNCSCDIESENILFTIFKCWSLCGLILIKIKIAICIGYGIVWLWFSKFF